MSTGGGTGAMVGSCQFLPLQSPLSETVWLLTFLSSFLFSQFILLSQIQRKSAKETEHPLFYVRVYDLREICWSLQCVFPSIDCMIQLYIHHTFIIHMCMSCRALWQNTSRLSCRVRLEMWPACLPRSTTCIHVPITCTLTFVCVHMCMCVFVAGSERSAHAARGQWPKHRKQIPDFCERMA